MPHNQLERASGILLHPTSLPGPFGVGTLGQEARSFVDFLVRARQSLWQILPLGPTGFGDSPYSTLSSMAGNPLLISLEELIRSGELLPADLSDAPEFVPHLVDYAQVADWKFPLLKAAATRFLNMASVRRRKAFECFSASQADWLEDAALFMAIKKHFDHQADAAAVGRGTWNQHWDEDIASRRPDAMARWRSRCAEQIAVEKVWQFFFFEQWTNLHQYANSRGVKIIGDIPIFVSLNSADVWASPHQFKLDDRHQPTVVAGVPPDYFSETGQRWGNPIYNWETMASDGFSWLIRRYRAMLRLVDMIRIDHFRGFQACWEIPATESTAVHGRWVPALGRQFFTALRNQLGDLPIIAEDLGIITPEVEALRDDFGFPGMLVLQFAFDDGKPSNRFLPQVHVKKAVVYPGTHDNPPTNAWYAACSPRTKRRVSEFLGHPVGNAAWDFIHLALSSAAQVAVIPMQDVLSLGAEARMNTPATVGGNWQWRMPDGYADHGHADRLAQLVEIFDRAGPDT